MIYSDGANAAATSGMWWGLTAMLVVFVPTVAAGKCFRYSDAATYFMLFVANRMPLVQVQGAIGIAIISAVAAGIIVLAWWKGCWSRQQWAWLAIAVATLLTRVIAGGHIHHIEWPWWLMPLAVHTKYEAIVVGILYGISRQEATGSGAFIVVE